MPYIKAVDRPAIAQKAQELSDVINTDGELNYAITVLIHRYVKRHNLCYGTLNLVMGVLDCVAKEFYRRVVAPYEDKKIKENTDIGLLQ